MSSLNSVTKICHFSKRARTCHPATFLCERPGCHHSLCKTHVRDRIFKLNPVHASVIYQICWIQWILVPFRENSNYTKKTSVTHFLVHFLIHFLNSCCLLIVRDFSFSIKFKKLVLPPFGELLSQNNWSSSCSSTWGYPWPYSYT